MPPSLMRKTQTSHSWRSLTLWWASLVWFRRRNAAFTLKWDLRDNETPYHLKIKPLSSAKVPATSILSQFFLKRQQCPRLTVIVTSGWNLLPLEYGSHSSQTIQLRNNPSSLSGFHPLWIRKYIIWKAGLKEELILLKFLLEIVDLKCCVRFRCIATLITSMDR